jgi:hypothetical protein
MVEDSTEKEISRSRRHRRHIPPKRQDLSEMKGNRIPKSLLFIVTAARISQSKSMTYLRVKS